METVEEVRNQASDGGEEEDETIQPLIRRSSRKKKTETETDEHAVMEQCQIREENLTETEGTDTVEVRRSLKGTEDDQSGKVTNQEDDDRNEQNIGNEKRRLKGKGVVEDWEEEELEEEIENDEEAEALEEEIGLEKESEEEETEDDEMEVIRVTTSKSRGRGRSKSIRLKDGKSVTKREEVQNRGVKRKIDDYFNPNVVRNERRNDSEFVIKVKDWHKERKVVSYAKYDILVDVKKLCTERVNRLLEESCLKNIIRMSVRKFPPKLIQQLLVRIVKNENPYELSFRLGSEVYTFGLCDFCLITGLVCSPLKNVDVDILPESELMETIFEGSEQVNWYELRDGFFECDFKDEELSLKISKLYLMESMVVAKQYQTNIEKMHFSLVEDDEAFNSYSWGRLSFNLLCASMKKILKFQNTKFHRLSGFPQALVIWACELLPALSLNSSYARRISFEYPRILNWDYNRQGTWRNYQNDIFKEPMIVQRMKPTSEELETNYLAPFIEEFKARENVANEKGTSKGRSRTEDGVEDEERRKKMEDDIQLIISQNYMMKISMENLNKKVEELQELVAKQMKTVAEDPMVVETNQMSIDGVEEEGHITDLRSDKDERMSYEKTTEETVQEKQMDKEQQMEVLVDKKKKSVNEGAKTNVMMNTKRIRKASTKLMESYTENFKAKQKDLKGPSFHILTPATQDE